MGGGLVPLMLQNVTNRSFARAEDSGHVLTTHRSSVSFVSSCIDRSVVTHVWYISTIFVITKVIILVDWLFFLIVVAVFCWVFLFLAWRTAGYLRLLRG